MKKYSIVHRSLLLTLIVSWVMWHETSYAESPVNIGTTLEAKNDVILRSSPPHNKFLFIVEKPGPKIATLKDGHKFKVKDVKEIAIPFGKDIWVEGTTEEGKVGWVYFGEQDNAINFGREE